MSLIGGTAVDLGDMAVTAGVGAGAVIATVAAVGVSKILNDMGARKFLKNKWDSFLGKFGS